MRNGTLKVGLLFGASSLLLTGLAMPALGATPVPSVITRWLQNAPSRPIAVLPTTHVHLKKYSRFAVVALKGGDYTSPVTAMKKLASWCGTPSETNTCLLQIEPGVYDLAGKSLNMQPYVNIEGAGEGSTIIASAVNSESSGTGVVNGPVNGPAELGFLTVRNTAATGTVIAISNQYGYLTLTHVTAIANGQGSDNYAIYNVGNPLILNDVTATATGAASNFGVYTVISNSIMNNVKTYAEGGTDSFGIYNKEAHLYVSNSTAATTGSLNSYGIFNSEASLETSNVTSTGRGTELGYGLYQDINRGFPSLVKADRSTFDGNTNSVFIDFNTAANAFFGVSKLVGPVVNNNGTVTCVYSYNGDYVALGANCQ